MMMQSLIRYLSQDRAIKYQVLLTIYISYLLKNIKQFYQDKYDRFISEHHGTRISGEQIDHLHLPDEPRWYMNYKLMSSSLMAVELLKNILPIETIVSQFNSYLPPHCFVIGKFLLLGPIYKLVTASLCAYHLFWRSFQLWRGGAYRLDMVAFLVQDREEIDRVCGHDEEILQWRGLPAKDKYLRYLIYYPIRYGSKVSYRFRGNRTPEARAELMQRVTWNTVFFSVQYFILFCFIAPVAFKYAFNDADYLKSFPNCSPEVDELARKGLLDGFSVTFTPHRILDFLAALFVNIFVWLDTGAAVVFEFNLIYLLNYDLLIYRRYLNSKLDELMLEVRFKQFSRDPYQLMFLNYGKSEGPSTFKGRAAWSGVHLHNARKERDSSYELVTMSSDYFEQIRCVDNYASTLIRMFVVIWLGDYAGYNYYELVSSQKDFTMGFNVRFFHILIIMILPLALYLFRLYQNNLRMYNTYCSLMAIDSSENKRRYMKIIDYYTQNNATTYTYFSGHPFTPMTFLTLTGWTFTCGIVMQSLFINMGNKTA